VPWDNAHNTRKGRTFQVLAAELVGDHLGIPLGLEIVSRQVVYERGDVVS
jgi:hypothetical protein